MFEFIGSIFTFAFGMVKLGLGLAWGAMQFVFGLLGGIFSLIMSLGGFFLAGALILVAIFRRKERRQTQSGANTTRAYDVDSEEFTSFYDQFRTEK